MEPKRTASLSAGELEALRHFLETTDPKVIGSRIGKSHHEVERRLKSARKKLGVGKSWDAAAVLAVEEGNPAYQSAVYGRLVRGGERSFDLIGPSSEGGAWSDWPLPFPTKGRPWNTLSIKWRVASILLGVLLLAISAVLLVSVGQAVSAIVRR